MPVETRMDIEEHKEPMGVEGSTNPAGGRRRTSMVRDKWDKENLRRAVAELRERGEQLMAEEAMDDRGHLSPSKGTPKRDRFSVRRAAEKYGIPKTTLHRYLKTSMELHGNSQKHSGDLPKSAIAFLIGDKDMVTMDRAKSDDELTCKRDEDFTSSSDSLHCPLASEVQRLQAIVDNLSKRITILEGRDVVRCRSA
uniref:HTH psq-type domain-containing protein n=1 Tax=Compsopogon caeruleus TaxID=31354 RepID=A0A6T6APV5_9RHOD|mmetsp:Transcript_10839/g.21740  ORF Transcript_10839/g.21740 Transcript_10839/m.21740 type:complete len:196 (+) Transcript_10839:291-878(+)